MCVCVFSIKHEETQTENPQRWMTSEWHETATAIQDQQQDGQTRTINDSSHCTSQGISKLKQVNK